MTYGTQSATDGPEPFRIVVPPGESAPVHFSADRSRNPDGSIVSWSWEIDGVEVSTESDFPWPLEVGEYSVRLTVTDDARLEDSADGTIQVDESQPPPCQPPTIADWTSRLTVEQRNYDVAFGVASDGVSLVSIVGGVSFHHSINLRQVEALQAIVSIKIRFLERGNHV
jgi:hypothetical protein